MADPATDLLARLTARQRERLAAYRDALLRTNRSINLVSRDVTAEDLWTHHILHCLAFVSRGFPVGARLVDWGTGGGLPALPVAICFPDVTVYAVDAVGKKVRAVEAFARRLGVSNVYPWHGRAEAFTEPVDYSVSRATAPLADLWSWHAAVATPSSALLEEVQRDTSYWPVGLICLKGGDLSEEVQALRAIAPQATVDIEPLGPAFGDLYYAEKHVVTVRERSRAEWAKPAS